MTVQDALDLLRRGPITPDRNKKLKGFCARTGIGYDDVLKQLTADERAALTGA